LTNQIGVLQMTKEPIDYKHNVEAILFSTGRKMTIEEIAKLCRIFKEDALKALRELQSDYNARSSSLMVVDEGDLWKLTIRERHLPVVKKIIAETELPKSIIETLAVIAWKAPVLQSDIIKIRTNKAYEHLKELESAGYITRQKNGRTNLVKLSQKFFQYFDLPPEKLQQMFKNITEIEQAIIEKEKQLELAKLEHSAKEAELKKQQELAKKLAETQVIEDEIDLITDKGEKTKLELYGDKSNQLPQAEAKMKIGTLEVFEQDNESGSEMPEHKVWLNRQFTTNEETQLENKEDIQNKEKPQNSNFLQISDEMVDKRVSELLHPETEVKNNAEEDEGTKKNPKNAIEEKKESNEAKDLLEASAERSNNSENNKNRLEGE